MSCEGLINRLGYSCREVGEKIIAVETPFSFADGEPINFYIDDSKELVTLHDNADTLAHLMGMGWDITDRRGWKGIKNIVSAFGLELQDDGAIVGKNNRNLEFDLIAKYISAMLAVVDWEREYLGLTEEQIQYVQEVEMCLRASNREAEIILLPCVEGHSGKTHTFHFDFDGMFVDAAKPRGVRTGAILRKAADVINTGNQKKILVVMDDREDVERAKAETDILSTMVSVLQFTVLADQSRGAQTQH